MEALAKSLKIDPIYPEATHNQAVLLWRKGEITDVEAIRRMEGLCSIHPGDWRSKYLLGLTQILRKDAEAAECALVEAARIAPEELEPKEALALVSAERDGWPRCLRTLEVPRGNVDGVSISADGTLGLSGGVDRTLRLWDLRTGQCLRTFEGHKRPVYGTAVSPDARFALSAGDDRSLRLWDLKTGECLSIMEGHQDAVLSVEFLPDGTLALSASDDGTVRLWDLRTGKCVRTLAGHEDRVRSIAISADGRFGLSGSWDCTLRLWDLRTGRCRRIFKAAEPVEVAAISPDGLLALSAGASDRAMHLWDARTGEHLRAMEGFRPQVGSVCFLPDTRYALSTHFDILRLWDLRHGSCLLTLEGTPTTIALSRDGRFALSGGRPLGVWRLGEIRNLDPTLALGRARPPQEEVSLHREYLAIKHKVDRCFEDGNWAAGLSLVRQARALPGFERHPELLKRQSDLGAKGVRKGLNGCWSVHTLSGHRSHVNSAVICPDGRFAVSASDDQTLRLWDLKSGRCLRSLEGHTTSVRWVALSADNLSAISGSWDHLRCWDTRTGECLRILNDVEDGNAVAVSPDGTFALSLGQHDSSLARRNAIIFWDLRTGETVHTLMGHEARVSSVVFFRDGRHALSGADDRTACVWNLESGRCLLTLKGHKDRVKSVCASDDGRLALSGSVDHTLRLWDLTTGQCLRTLRGHVCSVSSCTFSPDGRMAISGSDDKTLRLWDLTTGQCLRVLDRHTDSISTVTFSPDGRFALSGSWDHSLRLWEFDWEYEFPAGSPQGYMPQRHPGPGSGNKAVEPEGRSEVQRRERESWWKRMFSG